MKCPYCHEEVDSVVVIQRVELLADLDGDTIGEYYQDDDPITEIEDIRCRECDGSLFELIKE